jgi:hypothetical protein
MAPVIMGNADRPELGAERTNSFCRANPDIAAHREAGFDPLAASWSACDARDGEVRAAG